MAGPGKPPNPPQQAGQKRKTDSASDSSSKRPKPSANPRPPNGTNKKPPTTSKPSPKNQKPDRNSRQRRNQSRRDARSLATQTTSKAFSAGALDVDKFVKAREFEIRALQDALSRSKKARMERAFQSVPRDLRRRAGAWDVSRLPKGRGRREKARREIREDNTPTGSARKKKVSREARLRGETIKRLRALGAKRKARQEGKKDEGKEGGKTREVRSRKGVLKVQGQVKGRFKKRQLGKTWLPTHLWLAKRAHMSPPMEPVWRFAMPMTPTAKAYRPTHRAVSERGAVAWDVSYMGTIGLEGRERSLLGLLRGVGVDETSLTGRKGQLWRDGRRTWQGWIYARDSKMRKAIAPITVIWRTMSNIEQEMQRSVNSESPKYPRRKLFLRVHPSAFHELWEEVVRLCKVQKPAVYAEDLRFEIGSIEITGPASTEALQGALWSAVSAESADSDASAKLWQSLKSLDNPASLPVSSCLSFKISDPRLHHPPRTVTGTADLNTLLQTIVNFDNDVPPAPQAIFDSRTRRAAIAVMQSQKAINRRQGLSAPGTYPEARPNDPAIPIVLYTSSIQPVKGHGSSQRTASWNVLMPWKAVAPVWQSLMYYPLSTGGQVRFGGLREQRQIAFERCEPWYPGDFLGTSAGDAWEEKEGKERKVAWERRPRARRINFDDLDLGNGEKGERGPGWGMDWSLVLSGLERQTSEISGAVDKGKQPERAPDHSRPRPWHCSAALARSLLNGSPTNIVAVEANPDGDQPQTDMINTNAEANISTALTTVRISYIGRGTPKPAARIYRLPSDAALRDKWLKVLHDLTKKKVKTFKPPPNRLLTRPDADAHSVADITKLARDLLGLDESEGKDYPAAPKEQDLVGFVSSGGFNLREGKGTAIGSVGLERVREYRRAVHDYEGSEKQKEAWTNVCIVRNAGETVGRLGRWEIV
ncbi:Ribonucleases P/MRP protein subunit POP1-like protein [Elsinoe fawcettii]|nr:Ribonucleases P/MRP protein subunit POP1-like protein [Elsinoe fawcettii]